jgi:hypothetical protein
MSEKSGCPALAVNVDKIKEEINKHIESVLDERINEIEYRIDRIVDNLNTILIDFLPLGGPIDRRFNKKEKGYIHKWTGDIWACPSYETDKCDPAKGNCPDAMGRAVICPLARRVTP